MSAWPTLCLLALLSPADPGREETAPPPLLHPEREWATRLPPPPSLPSPWLRPADLSPDAPDGFRGKAGPVCGQEALFSGVGHDAAPLARY